MPAVFEAKEYGEDGIEPQAVTEDKVLVKLDKIADVSVEVTAKEMTLNIQDFGLQIVQGAMEAIAQKIDADIMGLADDIDQASGSDGFAPATLADLAAGRKLLVEAKAPLANRRGVFSPAAAANLLQLDVISKADAAGRTDGLREANMGRILGLDLYETQNATRSMLFHRDAFAFVSRPMALPIGGATGAVEDFEGIAIRVTADYEMTSKQNVMSFDVLYGVKTLRKDLAVIVHGKDPESE